MKFKILLFLIVSMNFSSEAQIRDWFNKTFYPDTKEIIGVWELSLLEKDGEKMDNPTNRFEYIAFGKSGHVAILKNYMDSYGAKREIEKSENLSNKAGTWSLDQDSKKLTINFFKKAYFPKGNFEFKYDIIERKKYSFDDEKTKFLTISSNFSNGYYLFEFEIEK